MHSCPKSSTAPGRRVVEARRFLRSAWAGATGPARLFGPAPQCDTPIDCKSRAEFGSAFVLLVLFQNEKVGFRARAWAGGRGSCQCPRPSPGTPHPPRARALRRPAPCAMRHGGFMVLVDSPTTFFSNLLAESSAASCREEMGCCFDAPWVSQHHHV